MDDLHFDPVKVDTSLAKEYIQKKTVIVEPKQGTAWDFNTKADISVDLIPYNDYYNDFSLNKFNQKFRKLSKKLKANCELFCQLEHLMREVDVDETRDCHLKLISQYFRCEEPVNMISRRGIVILKESTPLYHLGHVATAVRRNIKPTLVCEKRTASICQLFYELCLDVGLEISFYCINNNDWDVLPCHYIIKQPTMGCTIAITEDADMDSAVDVFLNSSLKAPWKIERIYVQESVYEQLMEVLKERKPGAGRGVECGAGAGAGGGVPVRAYRGPRELVALLDADSADAGGSLSLWCGAAAAAHELALASPSHLVWIDHYAAFDGPPSASVPLYNDIHFDCHIPESVHTGLIKLQRKWLTLPLDERKAVVLELLEKTSSGRPDDASALTKLTKIITDWTPSDLVDIASDRMTMVIDRPSSKVILFDCCSFDEIVKILKSAILGHLGVTDIVAEECNVICNLGKLLFSELYNAGVPLKQSDDTFKISDFSHISHSFYGNTKVIHSRFGTIYAN